MSTRLAVTATEQGGYVGLGTGNAGSTSAMAFYDKIWGAWALLLDAGIHAPMIAHTVYNFTNDGGAIGVITPKCSALIPAGAILIGSWYKVSTALAGSGNISVGTSAGASATAILGATAVSGLGVSGVVAQGVALGATPVAMTAQGQTIVTLSGTLTAGVFESFCLFVIPQNL